jgi:hypothetical protein
MSMNSELAVCKVAYSDAERTVEETCGRGGREKWEEYRETDARDFDEKHNNDNNKEENNRST